MSVPPKGVGPRGTLPLGLCPVYQSPCATRHAEGKPRGRWSAVRAMLIALGAVVIVGVVVTMSARRELRELHQAPELHAATLPPAPSTPEHAPPVALTTTPASAPTSTAPAASTARARQPTVPRRDTPAIARTSDIVDPWR